MIRLHYQSMLITVKGINFSMVAKWKLRNLLYQSQSDYSKPSDALVRMQSTLSPLCTSTCWESFSPPCDCTALILSPFIFKHHNPLFHQFCGLPQQKNAIFGVHRLKGQNLFQLNDIESIIIKLQGDNSLISQTKNIEISFSIMT